MADVEKLVMERRRLQWALLVTGAIWCGAMVLAYSPGFTPGMRHMLNLLCSVFMVIWAVPLFWFVIWQRRVKAQPLVFAAVNDELAIRNHWRAQRASRSVLIASLTLGIVVTAFVRIDALPVLLALTWIVTVSQLGFTLWFDRSE